MAYDAAIGKVVLFGSNTPSDSNGQTWTWDGAHWAQVTGSQPPSRTFAAAAYDGHGFVLFGGQGACPAGGAGVCPTLGDTWTFDGTSWQQQRPASSPGAAVGGVMTWDAALGKAVLVAEEPDGVQTWTWDGTAWAQVRTAHAPPAVIGAAVGYDPAARQVVLFGRAIRIVGPVPDTGDGNTYVFDGQDWAVSKSPGTLQPSARGFAVMVDDGNHLYLFGGSDATGQALADTWERVGGGWTSVTAAHQPPPRLEARGASGRGTATVYGGFASETQTNAALLSDTWVYDGRDWTQKAG
jgi:hypothetical protein